MPRPTTAQRIRNDRRGRRAELYAELLLRLKGYTILARRAKTHAGEIDLIVRRGNTLVFVEVKARATLDSGIFALHPAARARIDAASRILGPRFAGRCTATRIDAVLVRPWALPVHIEAVWREW